jgi:hypothetical protein
MGYFLKPKGNEDNSLGQGSRPRLHTIAAGGVGTPGGTVRPDPVARTGRWAWISLVLFPVFVCAVLFRSQNQPQPIAVAAAAPSPAPVIAATPAPIQPVPRAEPVSGPLTTTGEPMLSGRQYFVNMPDGRRLLVNYRGWVDHACNLPSQPLGGANNAAYTDSATGHTWIWTVPAGVSNVPRWIDP